MKLLDFVALYGLILMPMGAIIFIDYHLFPRLKLTSERALSTGQSINWAAAGTWGITLTACLLINQYFGVEIFFLGLPGWFIAVLLYIGFSYLLKPSASLQPKLS
jgi:purine-cytosine permease-like protein